LPSAERNLEEIQDLNLTYLLLVQQLLRKDRATAIFRLKISEGMADLMLKMTSRQLSKLAKVNQLVCRPIFDEAECLSRVVNDSRDLDLVGIHSSLLMASVDSANTMQGRG
jgi:flagellar transcriptional activator FlhD